MEIDGIESDYVSESFGEFFDRYHSLSLKTKLISASGTLLSAQAITIRENQKLKPLPKIAAPRHRRPPGRD
jgi:hypothetical protein